jgi:hypothetical protein
VLLQRPSTVRLPGVKRPGAIPLLCGVIALAVGLAAVVVEIAPHQWRVSALVRMTPTDAIAPLALKSDPNFVLLPSGNHYDGVYYYAVARDPLARGDAHTFIDQSPYRYGHAGYGWLAWLLSFGNALAIPLALVVLGLVGMTTSAVVVSRIAMELGWTPWAGLFAAFSPGLITGVIADTTEPIGVAAVALAVLFWMRGRLRWSVVFLIAACLIKEPYVLVPAALAVWESVLWLRGRRPDRLLQRGLALGAGPVLFACWYTYLRFNFGIWSFQASVGLFSPPVTGWVGTLQKAVGLMQSDFNANQLGAAMVPILLAIAGALIAGATRAVRLRSPLDALFLMFFGVTALLNWWTLLYPKDMIRELTLPLLLLPAALASLPKRRTAVRDVVSADSAARAVPSGGAGT